MDSMFKSLDDLVDVSILGVTKSVSLMVFFFFQTPVLQIQIHSFETLDEYEDFHVFVDLLKLLLHIDGNRRISPSDALNHPFITMSHLSNPRYQN